MSEKQSINFLFIKIQQASTTLRKTERMLNVFAGSIVFLPSCGTPGKGKGKGAVQSESRGQYDLEREVHWEIRGDDRSRLFSRRLCGR